MYEPTACYFVVVGIKQVVTNRRSIFSNGNSGADAESTL